MFFDNTRTPATIASATTFEVKFRVPSNLAVGHHDLLTEVDAAQEACLLLTGWGAS